MWIKNTDLVDIARAALERHDNMILALRIIHDEHADYDIQPGEYCRPSYRWEDGECTDEVLSGTSAIDARMLLGYNGAPTSYYGDRILVITGTDQVRGEDDCEVVINDAIVLEIDRTKKGGQDDSNNQNDTVCVLSRQGTPRHWPLDV
jgi:hypothetical protein